MRTAMLLALSFAILAPTEGYGQAERRPFLFKDARGELAQARARGEADVLLVIASQPDRNPQVAGKVDEMGGTVMFRADDVDYLRAKLPIDAVEALVGDPDVHSIDLSIVSRSRSLDRAGGHPSELPTLPGPSASADTPVPAVHGPAGRAEADTIWPPVLSDRPLTTRYSPMGDVGAAELREANPTWDGRGVTVAMIDMSPDMLLPELQTAMSLDGQPIPKIAIYEAALDSDVEDDGRWLAMDDMVEAVGGAFSYRDSTYQAPRDGVFRFALFDEAHADTSGVYGDRGLDHDVNRDGNPEGSSRLFGVIWDESTGDVWVDTDQDRDFNDETALGEYNARPGFGVFGTDDPETPVRESIGFAVQIDEDKGRVALNLGVASHASLVVGAAVGSRGEHGRFDGMAPGAQLASVAEGGSAYGQTEATILAARHESVDVIYFEQSSNITHAYLLRDGRLVPSVIGERLVERYGPSILSPTHNFPVLGAIDDIVMGRGVLGIGGHESKDNFFLNHGVRVEHDDNLLITGGYGPMGDGSLKPDVISPSNYVSTWLGFQEGRAIPGLFQLPPGYTIAGGTSTATPTAAGAVAMLYSAARQAGVPVDAYTMKYAVTRAARWVPHIAAYKQGNGVVDVGAAWEILTALAEGGLTVDIEARAPVRTPYSHMLPTPHEGVGLYERSGWEVGDRQERIVTLTRTSGPSSRMTFDIEWAGNDRGTFSAPLSVTLPLNSPVEVPITVAPAESGVHSAHLTLRHDDVVGYAFRMLATIVAPERLTAGNDYTMTRETEVPRPGMQSFFVDVPEGVSALKVEVGWEEREVAVAVVRPDTRYHRAGMVEGSGGGTTQVVVDPTAGTWEIRLSDIADTRTFDWEQAKKAEPVPPTPATLTVSALATDIAVVGGRSGIVADNGDNADNGSAHSPETHQVWITNRMAEFTGAAASTPVGSARRERRTIARGEQHLAEVEVLPGSTSLMVRTDAPPGVDLDVYVFDCTGDECSAAQADGDPVGNEAIVVERPAAGTWKIVVDGADVPADGADYGYLDVVLNQAYGMVSTVDVPQERATGARWTATAHSWIAPAVHGEGREPWVAVRVEGREGEAPFWIGVGEVRESPGVGGR